MKEQRKKYLLMLEILAAMMVVFSISVVAAIKNNGLEGDEVFSYISATSTGGFKGICYLEDQTWYDAEYFENSVTAMGTECFNIKMVVENQIMDTHPPLYYIILNLICSVFEGQYSRWFGIGLNIFLMLWVNAVLYLLINYFIDNKHIAVITSTIFCCSYMALDMTLFIRMYVLCMMLIVFQSWYYLKIYDKIMSVDTYPLKKYWKTYLCIMLLALAGGLTHYYFLVYQCLAAAAFVSVLCKKKKYKDAYRYTIVMAASAVLYVALYPASVYHIFFKYRGQEAVHKFLKESSLSGDVFSMFSAFSRKMFKGSLFIIILFLAGVTIVLLVKRKIDWKKLARLGFLMLPSLVYFYGTAKASPYIITRYISPVAALLYAGIVVWIKYIADTIPYDRIRNAAYVAVCVCLFCTCFFFFNHPVKEYYFEERDDIVSRLSKEAAYCVYICNGENYWKMWEDYINYPVFQGLYFIDGQKKAPIMDQKLLGQDKLVIYLDNSLDIEEISAYLCTYLPLSQYDIVYSTNYTHIMLGHS